MSLELRDGINAIPGIAQTTIRACLLEWLLVDPKFGMSRFADSLHKKLLEDVNLQHMLAKGGNKAAASELQNLRGPVSRFITSGEEASKKVMGVALRVITEEPVSAFLLAYEAVGIKAGTSAAKAEQEFLAAFCAEASRLNPRRLGLQKTV